MAMDDSMLGLFHNDLDRSEHLLRLVKEFRDFAGSAVPSDDSTGAKVWEAAEDLHVAATRVRTDLPIFAGSIHLYICGRFEFFVRQLVVAVADEIAATSADYQALPEKFRQELWGKTLEVAQNPNRYGYSQPAVEQLLVTLSNSVQPHPPGQPVKISSAVLAVTEANMNSRTMTDIFKRVNINSIWPDIGKQASMKSQLNKTTDGECTKAAQAILDEMMADRNSIAHPTSSLTFPDPDKVLSMLEYLRTLSQNLVELAKVPRPSA